MGPTWDRQDPGGPHVGPMNFAIWDMCQISHELSYREVTQMYWHFYCSKYAKEHVLSGSEFPLGRKAVVKMVASTTEIS